MERATETSPSRTGRLRSAVFTTGNVLAGMSVGAYFIPQAMAYGTLAGIEPTQGLAVAAVPILVYMILGRSRYMSVGPESTVALMTAAAVGPVAATMGVPALTALAITSILVGLILGAAWLLKASFLADLLSQPILLGYLTGVAVLMIMSQLPKMFDYDMETDTLPQLLDSEWQIPDYRTLTISLVVLVIALVMREIWPRFPGTLIGLAASILLGLVWTDVPKVGPVSLELPSPQLSGITLEAVSALLIPALSIAVISFTDVMATSRAFSVGMPTEAGLEMRAMAAVQGITGLAGGYPMSASSSRTALASAAGATSRFFSIFVVVVLIGGPLLIPGVIAQVPLAGLAGVILYAAITLFEPQSWLALARFRKREVTIAAVTVFMVVVFGILQGIIVAIFLSIAEFMARLARPHEGVLGFVPEMAGMHDVDDWNTSTTIPGLVVFRYDAPLFFMNAFDFYTKVRRFAEPGTTAVILNMEANVELDSTALTTLEQLHDDLDAQGTELWLARVKRDVLEPMMDHGVGQVIGEANMYPTLPVAVQAYRDRYGFSESAAEGQAPPESGQAPRGGT